MAGECREGGWQAGNRPGRRELYLVVESGLSEYNRVQVKKVNMQVYR